jgi:hypothetical protein
MSFILKLRDLTTRACRFSLLYEFYYYSVHNSYLRSFSSQLVALYVQNNSVPWNGGMVVPSFRRNLSELIIVALIYRFLRRMQLVYVVMRLGGLTLCWTYIQRRLFTSHATRRGDARLGGLATGVQNNYSAPRKSNSATLYIYIYNPLARSWKDAKKWNTLNGSATKRIRGKMMQEAPTVFIWLYWYHLLCHHDEVGIVYPWTMGL